MQKYFVLAEMLGWLGVIIFFISSVTLAYFYFVLFKSKNKVYSLPWIIICVVIELIQITAIALFVSYIFDPYYFTGQGKRDNGSAVVFIMLGLINLVVPLIWIILVWCLQPYFGAYIKDERILISFKKYDKSNFEFKKRFYYFGISKRWKRISLSSTVGQFINNFINNQY